MIQLYLSAEELKTYTGRAPIPEDFDVFWDKQLADLQLPDVDLFRKDFNLPNVNCYEIHFKGTNGGKIYAKLVVPAHAEKSPVIFNFHGYMGRSLDWAEMLGYTAAGYGFVSLDVRGQSGYSIDGGLPVRGNTVKGQIIRGVVDGPEHLFYKDVFLDVYSLIEIVAGLDFVDESNLSSYGFSQGGALSLVAAALNPRIKQTVSIAPFLCDFSLVLELGAQSEPYDELFRYFKFHDPFHETEEEIMRTLSYIDVKNLAHRIKGSVKLITNLRDDICYPETQYAVFNNLSGPKEHYFLQEYSHEDMHVYVSDKVFNWLCGTSIKNESLLTTFKEF